MVEAVDAAVAEYNSKIMLVIICLKLVEGMKTKMLIIKIV